MLARKSSRALVGLALLIGFVFGTSSLAGAHAVLLSLAPEPDAVLAESPPEVVLAFSEPVSATSKAIRVFDPTGEEISGISPKVENSVLSVKLPTLSETGSYTVAWKVVSDDGHQVSGAFLFHLKEATLKAPVAVGYEGAAALPRVMKVIGSVLTWAGLNLRPGDLCGCGSRYTRTFPGPGGAGCSLARNADFLRKFCSGGRFDSFREPRRRSRDIKWPILACRACSIAACAGVGSRHASPGRCFWRRWTGWCLTLSPTDDSSGSGGSSHRSGAWGSCLGVVSGSAFPRRSPSFTW